MTRTTIAALAAFLATIATPAQAQAISGEVELFEVHLGKGDDHLVVDSALTLFEGPDQLVLKIEGGSDTRTQFDELTVQALYARNLSDTVQVTVGLRHDFRDVSDLTHGVLGLEAELAEWLSGEHIVFVSQHGDVTGEVQLVASFAIVDNLALEPRVAASWSAQAIAAEELGSGLTDMEASVRLRQSLGGGLDVYAGVIHERLLGDTRRIAIAGGDTPKVTRAIIGAGFAF